MSGEVDGLLCVLKSGTQASPTAILGQGSFSMSEEMPPVIIDNKDSAGRHIPDGMFGTIVKDITIEFDINDDAAYKQLETDAQAGTSAIYTVECGAQYLEATFRPVRNSTNGEKGSNAKANFTFHSVGVPVWQDVV